MTNRRDLFKAAGLAGAAALVSGQTLAAPKKGAARVLKGGVEYGEPLSGVPEMGLSKTFATGKSVLNDGIVMNASHWGVYKVHVL